MAVFDRILGDALDFIRRFLWWKTEKDGEPTKKPFQVIRTPVKGDFGQISLVIGRDTPRAVRSWIFSPYNFQTTTLAQVKEPLDDIHIYLDFLGPLPNAPETKKTHWQLSQRKASERGEAFLTHRVQILKASHMLNAQGFYDYELLYWNDYDFHRPGTPEPERWAIAAVDTLAHRLLTQPNPDWATELEAIRQTVLGQRPAAPAQVAQRRSA
jgi:hypothetical protein